MTSKLITRRATLKRLGAGAVAASAFSLGMPSILRAQQGPIKLGFLSGMTGLETILGETQLNCFKLAVSHSTDGTICWLGTWPVEKKYRSQTSPS